MSEISKINISNISQHPGERLLRWMSIKGEGSMSEFKFAVSHISSELQLENWIEEQYFSYERILDIFINLLHIERDKNKWNIAKASINVLPGINNKAVLTGSRNEVLIESLLKNSLEKDESYSIYLIENGLKKEQEAKQIKIKNLSDFYGIFTPYTILLTDYDDIFDLQTLSLQLDIALNEISPIEYVKSLPTLDEYILMHDTAPIAKYHVREKFTKFFNSTSFISYNREINFDVLDGNNKVENCLYRYEIHGSQHKYYIYKNEHNYFLTEESVGFWKQISRLKEKYCFFIEQESLSGVLVIPTTFKLPKIYLKALGFCLAVTPRTLKPARSDSKTNPKMDIFLNIPTNVATTLISEKLDCELTFVNDFSEIENYIEII